jgi:hypothetical protein
MLSYILTNCSMNEHILVFTVITMITMISFAVHETLFVTAQSNSTNSDKQKIIVTWLDINDTETSDTSVSVSGKDFWKTFEPLLKQSINGP